MKRSRLITAVLVAIAVVGAAFYFASPLLAFNSLRSAVKSGDRDQLERLVDFPSVRNSLKSQIKARLLASFKNDRAMRDNPFAALAIIAVPAMIDQALNATMTPEGLSQMIQQGRMTPQVGGPGGAAARTGPAGAGQIRASHLRYTTLDTFKADLAGVNGKSPITLVMGRRGLFGWKVTRVELPADMLEQTAPAPALSVGRAQSAPGAAAALSE